MLFRSIRQSPNGLLVYDDDGHHEVAVEGVHDERMAELDEMYDLDKDPYEINNIVKRPAVSATREKLKRELRALAADALGL